MKTLLIVFHSVTGGARAMAEAAALGAAGEPGTRTMLLAAADATEEAMLQADGYIFACPEMLAAISGGMKMFFDRCYYPLEGRIAGRAYASLICAGSDGTNAARQIARIATGWRLRAVAEPMISCVGAQTAAAIAAPKVIGEAENSRCAELGLAFATGLAAGVF